MGPCEYGERGLPECAGRKTWQLDQVPKISSWVEGKEVSYACFEQRLSRAKGIKLPVEIEEDPSDRRRKIVRNRCLCKMVELVIAVKQKSDAHYVSQVTMPTAVRKWQEGWRNAG